MKSNKISVYLLKKGKRPSELFNKEFKIKEFDENSTFYYDDPHLNEPSWIRGFFQDGLQDLRFLSGGSKGVYFKKIEIDEEERYFAIPFGYGHSMVNKLDFVDDFGLKIVLNLAGKIRKIETRTLSSTPKNTIEQLSVMGDLSEFGLNIEQDLIEEVTAKPTDPYFGENSVTGKVAFTVTVPVNMYNITDFLVKCHEYYKRDDYKERFSFIDQIKEIRNPEEQNSKLVEKLRGSKNDDVAVWMAIPEIIEWADVSGFSYSSKNENLVNDLLLQEYLDTLTPDQAGSITIDFLRKRTIACFGSSSDTVVASWPILNCLYCEITADGRKYLLSNGKWYEIAKDFVDDVESSYGHTLSDSSGVSLIDCNVGEYEDSYNIRLAASLNGILMDRKLVRYGGGSSSVEFCDVFDEANGAFIHVKNYYGSSALSHLFAQGLVSGELYLADPKFRKEVKKKESSLSFNPELAPIANDHKIIFGIISESNNPLNIPFFSKVNFRNVKRSLNTYGYKDVFLTKVKRSPE
ncbi:MAG: TIGR04141 family sporadically distributed protein [Candidatus Nanopelagicaceae bacterium]|nr:TIGR04141 family sporadically distributed protein [Candidatus Nanopelagicaceae bacterium]